MTTATWQKSTLTAASFNGAAAFRLRNDRSLPTAHSLKPRFNGAAAFRLRNDQVHGGLLRFMAGASMGPQPFGCGMEITGTSARAQQVVASMGPQPFGCGMTCRPSRTRNRCPGFNGAAAFRLRNAVGAELLEREIAVASMGPQPFGCGMGAQCTWWARPTSGFNGAAAFRLRNARAIATGCRWKSCFNGAAAFRLRNGRRCRPACRRSKSFNGAAAFRLRNERHGER